MLTWIRFSLPAATREYELWLGAMQRAEIFFSMRSQEREKTQMLLAQFHTAAVDEPTIDAAAELYRQWNPSHGVDANDAILAATAQLTGGKIYCLNTRHYPMRDLLVQRAWA